MRVYCLADVHFGNALCDEKKFVKVRDLIAADPMAYWVGLGDIAEWIGRHDKRHYEDTLASWVWGKHGLLNTQRDYVCDMIAPIKHKCLALIEGNHEDKIKERLEFDVHNDIVRHCRQNQDDPEELLDMGSRGFLVLHIGRETGEKKRSGTKPIVFYMRHYNSAGGMAGSHALSLERMTRDKKFDVGLAAHGHRLLKIGPELILEPHPRKNSVVSKITQAAECGSFLRSYDPDGKVELYAEKKDAKALATGYVVVDIAAHLNSGCEVEMRTIS